MKIKPTHGPGAAHIGFAMFGARGPLLNAVGGGAAGGGAPAAAPPTATPGAPAAQPQASPGAAPAIDEAALRTAEQRGRDSAFAELRRSGALKKSALAAMDGTATPATPQGATQAPADPRLLRELDRAIGKSGMTDKLNEQQWKRAERDFLAEKPSDAVAWLKDYFPGIGTPAATTTPPTAATAGSPAPTNQHPASGAGGAPARGTIPLDQVNVLQMSPEDIAHHVARVGPSAFKAQYAAALKGVRIKLTP